MPFFAALSGLGAVPSGYLDQQDLRARTQMDQTQAAQGQTDLAAGQLAGAALQILAGQGPSPAMPGANPVSPGSPSVPPGPQMPPQAPPPGPGPQGPPPQPMAPPPLPPRPDVVMGPPLVPNKDQSQPPYSGPPPQAAAPPQPGGGGAPPRQPGQPPGAPGGQQGQLSLQSIIQAVVKASGGKALPAVIASAVNKFIPLMNAQAQSQWREMSLALRQQGLDLQSQRQQGIEDRFEKREKRLLSAEQAAEGARKIEQSIKLRRLEQQFQTAMDAKNSRRARELIAIINDEAAREIQEWALEENIDPAAKQEVLERMRKHFRELYDQLSGEGRPSSESQPVAPSPRGGPRVPHINPATGRIED